MSKWQEFGNQVNHLVYVLATKNHNANIGAANRYVAEKTSYGEDSIRMMRQGKFLPGDEHTLEILVDIGKNEAALGKDWAENLLKAARCIDPQNLLDKYYRQSFKEREHAVTQLNPSFVSRISGAAIGCVFTLLLWTYVISPLYPAPHELPLVQECLWGSLIGLGCAIGIAAADIQIKNLVFHQEKLLWLPYIVLPAGGVFGAVLWKLCTSYRQMLPAASVDTSSVAETFCFGLLYGLAFALSIVIFRRTNFYHFLKLHPILTIAIISGSCAFMALAGYTLAILQPSFANQKDVDIFVGLLLRIAVILNLAIFFPIPVRLQPPMIKKLVKI
jgi:hypothetical protein